MPQVDPSIFPVWVQVVITLLGGGLLTKLFDYARYKDGRADKKSDDIREGYKELLERHQRLSNDAQEQYTRLQERMNKLQLDIMECHSKRMELKAELAAAKGESQVLMEENVILRQQLEDYQNQPKQV